jgi:hypothetical protein
MPSFNVGDHVRWTKAVLSPEYRNAVGTVESINPNDTGVEELTLYDIKFPFGTRTLYSTQIEIALDERKGQP